MRDSKRDTDVQNSLLDSVGEGEGGIIWENGIETYNIRNESPVQVRCRIQDVWCWCTGMTQKDGMGREVEGGSGWGTRVHPWWIHADVWQNQYNYAK